MELNEPSQCGNNKSILLKTQYMMHTVVDPCLLHLFCIYLLTGLS